MKGALNKSRDFLQLVATREDSSVYHVYSNTAPFFPPFLHTHLRTQTEGWGSGYCAMPTVSEPKPPHSLWSE